MQDFVTQFFTMTTLAFVVGISVLVLLIRKIVEKAWQKAVVNLWWSEIVLPALPILLAVGIAWGAKKYPYPEAFSHSLSGRLFFGLVCGAFADLIYMKIKKMISAFASGDTTDAAVGPLPPPTAPKP